MSRIERIKHCDQCELCRKPIKERIKYFLPQLRKICRAAKSQRHLLLQKVDHCFLHFISDCSFGILKHLIVLPKQSYKRLREFKNDIIAFGHFKTSIRKKRRLLIDKNGGFLPLILPALASAVFGVLGSLITKKLL